MRQHLHAITAIVLVTTAAAQGPAGKVDPMRLVGHAENLLQSHIVEQAVLVLWEALDVLATPPHDAANDAAATSVRALLAANDPRDEQRRDAFASAGRQQADLAAAYRAKKWLETAAALLDVAERYDHDAAAKERAALDAAIDKPAKAARPALCALLQKKRAVRYTGEWREVGDCLEAGTRTGDEGNLAQFVPAAAKHEDNQITVEWKPADPAQDHVGGLWIGLDPDNLEQNGYHARFSYDRATKEYWLCVSDRSDPTRKAEGLGNTYVLVPPTADGFHRVVVQVRGARIRMQIDDTVPLDVIAPSPARGSSGLCVGVQGRQSGTVQYRNLRIDPLPLAAFVVSMPPLADDAAEQRAIGDALEEAKALLAKKQPEAASWLLHDALARAAALDAGEARDKLRKAIDQVLPQADAIAARRAKTGQAVAAELVAVADEYGKAGLRRLALTLIERAAVFDPMGQSARLATARRAAAK